MRLTEHRCPKPGCDQVVPNSMFACRPHWFSLSVNTRAALTATARLPLTNERRWDIVSDAMDELHA